MNKQSLVRLYLAKGASEDCDIYVDTVPLPQHQYDGVRFLYRTFKKGKSGVILNDPSGYGKRVQTVLFFNAVSPMLRQPTLILCPEGRENMWMHLFRQWTNIGSDIAVQRGQEYTKSMCLVGNFSQASVLARREWGILVVDDQHLTRDVLRAPIYARFRIWITTIDMKKNLQTFSMIYKWLYPRERFVVEDFQTTSKKPSIMLEKSIRLDAYMEDIVLRRRNITVPLGTPQHMPVLPMASRKNKDATGKKIKRSKPLTMYEHDTNGESQDITPKDIPDATKNGGVGKENESVEDFEVKQENIENKSDVDLNQSDLTQSDIVSECDPKEQQSKEELKDNDDIKVETNTDINLNENVDNQNSESVLANQPMSQYDSETPDLDEPLHDDDVPTKRLKVSDEITDENNEVSASEDMFSMDIDPNDMSKENIKKNREIKSANLEIASNVNTDEKTSDEVGNEIKKDDLNCEKDESDGPSASKEKTEPKSEGIELKIKELEELVNKKYGGTFLGSIL